MDDYVVIPTVPLPIEEPALTSEALENLGCKDPLAAAAASVVARWGRPSSACFGHPTDEEIPRSKVAKHLCDR